MSATRRDFLKATFGGATLVSLGPTLPTFLNRTARAAAPRRQEDDRILIVVQLAGGNDGLNTVVPFDNDHYGRNRDTLRLKASEVLKISDSLGFHPRLQGFERLFKDGHLSVVQGVGYPKPSGGHFESMRYWQSGQPHDDSCQTGWLGRAVDRATAADDALVPAVYVGQIAQPFTLHTQRAIVPTVRSLDACKLQLPAGAAPAKLHGCQLTEAAELRRPDAGNPLVDFLHRSTLTAGTHARQVEEVARSRTAARPDSFPNLELAEMFRVVTQLLRADLGIRIFYTELGGNEPGGFDNHANQRDNHAALLHQLSESIAALVRELQQDQLLDRVLLMTFSEFGRTLLENGRRGTDHGSAAPVFLVGGKLRGGLIGPHPSLTDLENGGPKFHTDFRRLYATVLDRWLGFDSHPVLGAKYEPLDVFARLPL